MKKYFKNLIKQTDFTEVTIITAMIAVVILGIFSDNNGSGCKFTINTTSSNFIVYDCSNVPEKEITELQMNCVKQLIDAAGSAVSPKGAVVLEQKCLASTKSLLCKPVVFEKTRKK